ncbi:MAG: M1 family metallopeptidase [Bacteroidales bacterium]|nr:M1 family metallopeptidase [Bacteroidales bacterium]
MHSRSWCLAMAKTATSFRTTAHINCKHLLFHNLKRVVFLFVIEMVGINGFGIPNYSNSNVALHYLYLSIEASDTSTYLNAEAEIHGTTKDLPPVFFLSSQLTITEVKLLNQDTPYQHVNDSLVLFGLSQPGNFEIKVSYQGYPGPENWIAGVFNKEHRETKTWVTWTLSEPFSAYAWYPAIHGLHDKIDSLQIDLITPPGCIGVSNGIMANTAALPNGNRLCSWKSNYPTPYYLVSYAIGNYLEHSFYAPLSNGDSVHIKNYLYNDSTYLANNLANIEQIKPLIRLYDSLFGPYPFINEKYGHCTAPMGGGMENQTVSTVHNFSFNLLAHELAHQWVGNSVTCSSFNHIWIHEGLASYAEYMAIENLVSVQGAKDWLEGCMRDAMLANDGRVYAQNSEVYDIGKLFNGRLRYNKGACLVHMIRHTVDNDSLFYGFIKAFCHKYKYGTAGIDDFKNLLEQQTGLDFTDFFNQWYYGEGHIRTAYSWKIEHSGIEVKIKQQGSAPDKVPYFKTPIEVAIESQNKTQVYRLFLSQPEQIFTFKVKQPKKVKKVVLDPDNWLLMKVERKL